MNPNIQIYNDKLSPEDKQICNLLAETIDKGLTKAESKIWHAIQFGFWMVILLSVIINKKQDCV